MTINDRFVLFLEVYVIFFQAAKVFEEVRRVEPYHVEGIELYSTVLWHLQVRMTWIVPI